MDLMQAGNGEQAIRAYLEAKYRKFGPPTGLQALDEAGQHSCGPQTGGICGQGDNSATDRVNTFKFPQVTVPQTTDNEGD